MEKKSKVSLSVGWAAAFTWFGSHCGSGFASGRQIVQYTTRHGIAGIWIPILTWALLCWFTYWAVEYSRAVHARNYRDFVMVFYGPLRRIILLIFDVVGILGGIVILAAMYAAAAQLGVEVWGLNYWVGSVIIALICTFCAVLGYKVFSTLSAFITIPMIAMLLVVQIAMIAVNWDNLMVVIKTSGMSAESGGILDMVKDAFTYAGVQSGMYATLIGLAYADRDKWTKKNTKEAVIGGSVLNWFMHTFNCVMVFAAYPWINNEPLVTMNIIKAAGPNWTWLVVIYDIVLFLAILTTAIGSVYAQIIRWAPFTEKFIKSEKANHMFWGLLFSLGSVLLASIGLTAVINKGYGLLGNLRTYTTIWPIAILGVWRYRSLMKRIEAGENVVPYDEAAHLAQATQK